MMRLRRLSRRGHATDVAGTADPRVAELQHRVEHLEAALEGLQDAVHREAVRQNHQLQVVMERTQPEAMARALAADARRRGV